MPSQRSDRRGPLQLALLIGAWLLLVVGVTALFFQGSDILPPVAAVCVGATFAAFVVLRSTVITWRAGLGILIASVVTAFVLSNITVFVLCAARDCNR